MGSLMLHLCVHGISKNCKLRKLDVYFADSVVQFLLNGMQQPKHAVACALSLSNITEKNPSNMVKHFDSLMSALQALEALAIYEKGVHYLIESRYNKYVFL